MNQVIRILFLTANPSDTSRLRLDKEIRAIDQALRQAEFRDRFDIEQHWAVRVTDLQACLLRHTPDIVHFSGHGSTSSAVILEDESGSSHPVSIRALSQLFSVLKDNIRCVVLNACYSEQQAQAIAEYIDCVIGMSKAIGDSAAIGFAMAFYQALGYGRNLETAFNLGCAQIDLENLSEQDTPKLIALKSNPEEIVFALGERESDGQTAQAEQVSLPPFVDRFVKDLELLKEEFDSKVRGRYSRYEKSILGYGVHPGAEAFQKWKEKYILFLMEHNLRREVDRFRRNTEDNPDPLITLNSSSRRAFEYAWGKYVDAQIRRLIEDAREGLLDRYLVKAESLIDEKHSD